MGSQLLLLCPFDVSPPHSRALVQEKRQVEEELYRWGVLRYGWREEDLEGVPGVKVAPPLMLERGYGLALLRLRTMDKGKGLKVRVSNECCPGEKRGGVSIFLSRCGVVLGMINVRVQSKAALRRCRVPYGAAQQ